MARLIKESEIRQLISMEEAVAAVRQTFKESYTHKVINPAKVNLDLGQDGGYPYHDGFINAMPAYVEWVHTAGLKWVVGMAGKRREAGLPYINSMMFLVDPELGEFKSVLSGTYISNLRTGAQSAVALSELIDKKDISIGLFGAGTQARAQIEAISTCFNITNLTVYNYKRSEAEIFAQEMQEYIKRPIQITTDPQAATNHDVLITVTLAQHPFLTREMIRPGTIVMPMGSFQEVSDDLILSMDNLYVDHIEQAFHRGAMTHLFQQGKIDESWVTATFEQLVMKRAPLPHLEKDMTLCIPIGTGALDVTLAGIVYDQAVQQNLGTSFDFDA